MKTGRPVREIGGERRQYGTKICIALPEKRYCLRHLQWLFLHQKLISSSLSVGGARCCLHFTLAFIMTFFNARCLSPAVAEDRRRVVVRATPHCGVDPREDELIAGAAEIVSGSTKRGCLEDG